MTNSSEVETLAIQPHKLLILDARSYAAAVANRAKGGGCECPGRSSGRIMSSVHLWKICALDSEAHIHTIVSRAKIRLFVFLLLPSMAIFSSAEYYPNCEVVFMGMANIHTIRKSFQSLRFLCTQMPDPAK